MLPAEVVLLWLDPCNYWSVCEASGSRLREQDRQRSTEDSDDILILTTSLVPEAIQKWIEDMKAKKITPMPRYEHIASCLRLAYTNLRQVAPLINQNMAISYISLGETFCYAANAAFNIVDLVNKNECPNQWHTLFDQRYWKDRMTASGFCKSQIHLILNERLSIQTLYFTSHLTQSKSENGHEQCKENECSAYRNNLEVYRTQHVNNHCDCGHLSVQPSDVLKILRDGYIPLLRVTKGAALSELSVDVVSSKDCPKYMALSHVRAEGLGNPTENALPRCQLDFLRRLLDHLKPSLDMPEAQGILLWCDTMCCPAEVCLFQPLSLLY